jgi:hypothetical protein
MDVGIFGGKLPEVCPIAPPASIGAVTKPAFIGRQQRHKLLNLRVSSTPQILTKVLAMSDALTYRAAGGDNHTSRHLG